MRACAVLLLLFVVVATLFARLTHLPGETVFHLLTGWQAFASRSWARLAVNWSGVATAATCMVLLLAGGHSFLKWLIGAARSPAPRWPLKRTVQLLVVLMLLFAAGTTFIGLVHQTAWLATSPEPLARSRLGFFRRSDPHANLKEIAGGFQAFSQSKKRCPPNGEAPELKEASHSWQARIIPYMNVQPPYPGIDFSRDWDAAENAPIFRRFVVAYLNPQIDEVREGRGYAVSHYAGNRRLFDGPRMMNRKPPNDGASNTMLCGEVAGEFAAWGDPANLRDPAAGVNRRADGFGSPDERGASFVMVNGSVRFVSSSVNSSVLAALASPADCPPLPPPLPPPPPIDPAARDAFEKRLEAGTVFDVDAFQEFNRNGWKRDFAWLLRERGKARCVEGICLTLEPLPNHVYRVGEPFDCVARLRNARAKPRLVDVGGSCGMTDALTLMVFSTVDGQVISCRGRAGGAHCFCKPKQDFIQGRQTVKIETGFAGDTAVKWVPDLPAEYVVAGAYRIKTSSGSTEVIYARPILLNVVEAAP